MRCVAGVTVACSLMALCACSSSSGSAAPSGGDGGDLSDGAQAANTGDAGGATAIGVVVDFTGASAATNFDATKYPPLPGVEVCIYGMPTVPCVMTDANGKYVYLHVPVPARGPVVFSYKKTGYQPTLYPAGNVSALGALFMFTTAGYAALLGSAGATIDPAKGEVFFGAGTGAPGGGSMFSETFGNGSYYYQSGYTVTVTPAPAAGPVYFSTAFAPDRALGAASFAGIGIIQGTPGSYTFAFSDPGFDCPPAMANVVAGYTTTYIGTFCSVADGGAPASDASAEGATADSGTGD